MTQGSAEVQRRPSMVALESPAPGAFSRTLGPLSSAVVHPENNFSIINTLSF